MSTGLRHGRTATADVADLRHSAGDVRLFVLAVDGTLLDSSHRVGARNVAAIERALRRGLQIMLVTARGPSALRPVLAQVPALAHEIFIASQGAVTARFVESGRLATIAQQQMPLRAARRLVRLALERGIAVHWHSRNQWHVSQSDHTVARTADIVGAAPTVSDLLSLDEGPDKLTLVAGDGRPESLKPVLEAIPAGLTAHRSHPGICQITRDDVGKDHAVARFARVSRIAPDEVLCVGSRPDDVGMLVYAGVGVAPVNASPGAIDAADFTTGSSDDAGVAQLLDALLDDEVPHQAPEARARRLRPAA